MEWLSKWTSWFWQYLWRSTLWSLSVQSLIYSMIINRLWFYNHLFLCNKIAKNCSRSNVYLFLNDDHNKSQPDNWLIFWLVKFLEKLMKTLICFKILFKKKLNATNLTRWEVGSKVDFLLKKKRFERNFQLWRCCRYQIVLEHKIVIQLD